MIGLVECTKSMNKWMKSKRKKERDDKTTELHIRKNRISTFRVRTL